MKSRDVIASAISNSFRSRLRTTLTVLAIFIGAFTLTITSAIGAGVSAYINTQVAAIGAPNIFTITKTNPTAASTGDAPAKYDPKSTATGGSRAGGANPALSRSDITTIGQTKGLTAVSPVAQLDPEYIQYGTNDKYQLAINPIAAVITADLAAGSQLDDNSDANQIMLPTTYLSSLGLGSASAAIGKSVSIGVKDYLGNAHTMSATVVAVQNKTLLGGGVGLNEHATTALRTLAATGKPASVATGYAAATARFSSDTSTRQVNAMKKELSKEGFTAQTVADQIGSFETVINGIIGVLDAFAVIALIAAGFGIINTLLMSVQERTREIGLMKAMGMSGGKIYALFSSEAVFIGFLGSAIGAGIAVIVGGAISRILARTLLSGLPGLQVMRFTPASIAIIVVVVMAIAFLAGTLPARRAARQNPIEALRYE